MAKKKKEEITMAEMLLVGSMDCEVLPDGRLLAKGSNKGMPIEPKTFY